MNQLWRFHVSPFSLLIVVLLAQPSAAQQATVIQQWRFDQASLDKQTLRSVDKQRLADLANSPQLDGDGSLSFSQGQFAVVRDGATDLPTSSFSVEAWVRIDATIRWGSVFGFQQDNGSYERGWSLGYNQDRFEFRVADDRHMINATAVTPMTLKQWHHVVGVCDTKRQQLRLYVDGKSQSVVSVKMDGANYPSVDDQTELVIGAYKDKDELFPMVGRLREVRLYDGVLNDDAIAAHVEWQQDLPEKALAFSVRPGVRFLSPTTAEVRWETTFDGVSALAFGLTRRPDQIVTSDTKGFSHRVVMKDLEPGKDYWYRFGNQRDGKRSFSPFYLLEGSMNYMPSVMERDDSHQPATNQIAKALPQQGGYAVTLGVDSSWPKSIATETAMNVIAVVDDPRKRNELRKDWYSQKVYGTRLSVHPINQVPDRVANLVVTVSDQLDVAKRLISPSGRVVVVGDLPKDSSFRWESIAEDVVLGTPSNRPRLAQWGHQYGSLGNASYSGETLNGVDNSADLEIRWIGRPGADFGIDRNPRMPAPLAIGGRLFHQGMNRMIALDAFNGTVLWSLEIPDLRRVNIPRDSANWCADTDHVYAAVKDRLWVINAATGEMERTIMMPERYRNEFDWGYVAVAKDQVIGTATAKGGVYSDFWSKTSWYDGKDDGATAKVCGRAIVAYDKKYGSVSWQHPTDAIVQSTIAIDDQHVYFVEVDDPKLKPAETGKLINDRIWAKASVVCLDVETGKQVWMRKVPKQEHEGIVSFGIADDGQYLLQTSGKGQFHFVALSADAGKITWQRSVDWPEDHHGAHVQHAVSMNGLLYVQPHILNAADGTVVKSSTLGKRRGCATPIGAGKSIIYRGGTGPLSLWSLDTETKSEFTRLRPSCWLSTIPAQGMLFSPEGGGGCSCGGWMETSIGFAPVSPGVKQ